MTTIKDEFITLLFYLRRKSRMTLNGVILNEVLLYSNAGLEVVKFMGHKMRKSC